MKTRKKRKGQVNKGKKASKTGKGRKDGWMEGWKEVEVYDKIGGEGREGRERREGGKEDRDEDKERINEKNEGVKQTNTQSIKTKGTK